MRKHKTCLFYCHTKLLLRNPAKPNKKRKCMREREIKRMKETWQNRYVRERGGDRYGSNESLNFENEI
jgi:hypothetical protein